MAVVAGVAAAVPTRWQLRPPIRIDSDVSPNAVPGGTRKRCRCRDSRWTGSLPACCQQNPRNYQFHGKPTRERSCEYGI